MFSNNINNNTPHQPITNNRDHRYLLNSLTLLIVFFIIHQLPLSSKYRNEYVFFIQISWRKEGWTITTFTASSPHHLLTGCATRASLPLSGCEQRIRERIGHNNDTSTRCCFTWYMWHCFEREIARICDPAEIQDAMRFVHFDKVVVATSECKKYPDKSTCDWQFYFLLPMWAIIMFIVLFICLCVAAIVLLRKCCFSSSRRSNHHLTPIDKIDGIWTFSFERQYFLFVSICVSTSTSL